MADPRAEPAWRALGDRAIRFARPPGAGAAAIARVVRGWPGVVDVVIAREHVAAYFGSEQAAAAAAPAWPAWSAELAAASAAADAEPARDVELPALYDGTDLDDVARATGLAAEQVVALHAGAVYVVDTIGFAPGFAYMTGLDPKLQLARRATPRPRVPAGSIAIAGVHTSVYPFDSPGGWHLLGRVDGVAMFGRDGALLRLGDRVRFVPRGRPPC